MLAVFEMKRRRLSQRPAQSPAVPTAAQRVTPCQAPIPDPARSSLALLAPPLLGYDALAPHRAEGMPEERRRYFESTRSPAGVHPLRGGAAIQRRTGADATGIPGAVRAKMETAFGTDFSGVRVHTASAQAVALGALAYTQGSEIHMAPGQWAPETTPGQELLGHELAHVVQQREGRVKTTAQMKGVSLNDESALEAEADAMGEKAARGYAAQGSEGTGAASFRLEPSSPPRPETVVQR